VYSSATNPDLIAPLTPKAQVSSYPYFTAPAHPYGFHRYREQHQQFSKSSKSHNMAPTLNHKRVQPYSGNRDPRTATRELKATLQPLKPPKNPSSNPAVPGGYIISAYEDAVDAHARKIEIEIRKKVKRLQRVTRTSLESATKPSDSESTSMCSNSVKTRASTVSITIGSPAKFHRQRVRTVEIPSRDGSRFERSGISGGSEATSKSNSESSTPGNPEQKPLSRLSCSLSSSSTASSTSHPPPKKCDTQIHNTPLLPECPLNPASVVLQCPKPVSKSQIRRKTLRLTAFPPSIVLPTIRRVISPSSIPSSPTSQPTSVFRSPLSASSVLLPPRLQERNVSEPPNWPLPDPQAHLQVPGKRDVEALERLQQPRDTVFAGPDADRRGILGESPKIPELALGGGGSLNWELC
jgi:hypothetical protein